TFDRAHLGSALSYMLQSLAGPLVGASGPGLAHEAENWGHLLIAIDPDHLNSHGTLAHGAERLADVVQSSRRRDPAAPVRVPGDRGDEVPRQAAHTGHALIDSA